MRDYTQDNVSLADVEKLTGFAAENDFTVDMWQGVLNDTYLIHANKSIKVGNVKPREYILCYHRYANPWGNTLHILHTDSMDKAREIVGTDDCVGCGADFSLVDLMYHNDGNICGTCDHLEWERERSNGSHV